MRTTLWTVIAVGAGLAQVGAVPLRIVVVSNSISQEMPSPAKIRMGHPTAMMHAAGSENQMQRRPCGGRMTGFREKAIEMSNAFRQALGMPLIESHEPNPSKMLQILPFIGSPPAFIEVDGVKDGQLEGKTRGGDAIRIVPVTNMPHPHAHHHHAHHFETIRHERSFLERLEQALFALGPWEGRAVAFVLGCGLGVLIRMLWVLVVVAYRSIKGERDDEHEYSQITVIEEYAEPQEVHLPPPNYTYADEKSPIVPEDKPAAI